MAGCDLSASMSGAALSEAEVGWLLASDVRRVLADPSAARTLVSRVSATLAAHEEQLRVLRADVTRMGERYKMQSSPLTAAVLALGRLSVDEQGHVFSAYGEGLLERLREQVAAARAARLAADSATRRVQLVVAELVADESLPVVARERLRVALGGLPPVGVGVVADPPVGMPVGGRPFQVPARGEEVVGGDELGSLFS